MASAAHPRSRGEHEAFHALDIDCGGSSPLARGTSLTPPPHREHYSAHPRSRGEHRYPGWSVAYHGGSSPLARGTLRFGNRGIPMPRLIPARAGNIEATPNTHARAAAHPRSRGEHTAELAQLVAGAGSSPLARGTRFSVSSITPSRRLIPARAGNIPRPW